MSNSNFVENSYIKLWKQDGILFCSFNKGTIIDHVAAQEIVLARINFSEGQNWPFLLDYTNVSRVTKEARDFFSAKENLRRIKAGAFIIKSPVTRIIINFYLAISKPQVPAQMFTDKDKAIAWLKTFP